jgi:hypothetical protein
LARQSNSLNQLINMPLRNYTNLLLKDEIKNQTFKATLAELSPGLHNPATPAGHPEGTQPKAEEDTKGPIRE